MQQRHIDRRQYFNELAITSERHFIPYIRQQHPIGPGTSVLEIGCGEGGNLAPFARLGCGVTGIDISRNRIRESNLFFSHEHLRANLICDDIFRISGSLPQFDIILCHDVIEHIAAKKTLFQRAHSLLNDHGVMFVAFPAWQMPFGGHQQICRSALVSHLPFIHLLPRGLYRRMLSAAGESEQMLAELSSIRDTRISIGAFESLATSTGWTIADRRLYLINPHYETKHGLTPRILPRCICRLPYLRNFISTSCLYLLTSHQPTSNRILTP